jgi:AP-3 complex subunit mu
MIDSLFVLTDTGDVLIEKHWRGHKPRSLCDTFLEHVRKAARPEDVCPVIATPGAYLLHIFRYRLFFLSVVTAESPPMMAVEFMQRVVEVLFDYFDGKVSQATIKGNFVTVYQILDEMLDNGYPLITEPNILREMIKPQSKITRIVDNLSISGQAASRSKGVLPEATGSTVPWRKAGVKYSNNEIFFDIIEEIDATIDCNGMAIACDVQGTINCNCHLSGMPDCTLTFEDPSVLDDRAFHPCVRTSRFQADEQLSFIPPDGKFKLMSYCARECGHSLPLYFKPSVSFMGSSGHIDVMVGSKAPLPKGADDVAVVVPLGEGFTVSSLNVSVGKTQFDEARKELIWKIGRLQTKDKSPHLSGSLVYSGEATSPPPPTLIARFRVPTFSVSGAKVNGLSIVNTVAKPYKGVRTITKSGRFQVRSN